MLLSGVSLILKNEVRHSGNFSTLCSMLSVLLSDDVMPRCSDFHVNCALQIFYDNDVDDDDDDVCPSVLLIRH